MKVFEYVIYHVPKANEKYDTVHGLVNAEPSILVGPAPILAKDEATAKKLAGVKVPEEFYGRIEEVEIAVRPF